MTVQLNITHKKKLEALAGAERRPVENQIIHLIENGLAVFEQGVEAEKNWS